MSSNDAVVVGSGPNGLAAAIVLAQAGLSVVVREAAPTIGGGMRSESLTLPGFVHDVCSSLFPLGAASPFLKSLPLERHGVSWVEPPIALAHPFDGGHAAALRHSLEDTASGFGADRDAYLSLMRPFVASLDELLHDVLAPLHIPRHPILLARFGWRATRSARRLVTGMFRGPDVRALFASTAAHAIVPIERTPSAAYALVLMAAAHRVGWPFVRGGSQRLADAMAAHLGSLGGRIETNAPVHSIDELESARVVLLDLTPPQILAIAEHRLSRRYADALRRYRFGPGVFKIDWALHEPVPWTASDCRRAGVVHLGGRLEEMIECERAPWHGRHAERPLVIASQPSLFDPTRAPNGGHTLWAYCHVPNGSHSNVTDRIEAQFERFAPGFRDVVRERHVMSPSAMQAHDANLIGGEIGGGENSLRQLFLRPHASPVPYRTPIEHVYICSASTPPGGAVHGMCGYYAAHVALRDLTAARQG